MGPIPSSALQKRERYNKKGRAATIQAEAAAAEGRHHKRKREYALGDDEAEDKPRKAAIGGGNGGEDGGLDMIYPVERKKLREQVSPLGRGSAKGAQVGGAS